MAIPLPNNVTIESTARGSSPFVLLMLSALAGNWAAHQSRLTMYGMALVLFASMLILLHLSWHSLPLTLFFASSFVGIPGRFLIGPISGLGLLTAVFVTLGLAYLLQTGVPGVGPVTWTIPLFIGWAAIPTIAASNTTINGYQNLAVLILFACCVYLGAGDSRNHARLMRTADAAIRISAWVAIGCSVLSFGLPNLARELGAGRRTLALFSLICLAWEASRWRSGSRSGKLTSVLVVAAIAVSLSRTALAVGLLMVALSRLQPSKRKSWIRVGLAIVCGATAFILCIRLISPLRRRFLEGDVSVQIGGLAINGEGRMQLWRATLDSYEKSPWIGQGAGSAESLINVVAPGLGHPHNDYLRILHDYGLVGMLLWALMLTSLLIPTARAWLNADELGRTDGYAHAAAFASLVALSLVMLTDNAIVYSFFMAPLGTVIGISLALRSTQEYLCFSPDCEREECPDASKYKAEDAELARSSAR